MTREEAIEKLKELLGEVWNEDSDGRGYIEPVDMAIKALREPEVVRCKDCKHYMFGDCTEMPKLTGSEDFCSWAERNG